MIQKTITIGEREVTFKSSAAIPRIYRTRFGRDLFKDLAQLEQSFKVRENSGDEASLLAVADLEIFENVAYTMAYAADPSIPETIEEWLDGFEMFSIYQVLPQILALWGMNLKTTVSQEKNSAAPQEK